jgi:hypothetical protein
MPMAWTATDRFSAIPGDAIMIGRSLDPKTKTMVSVLEKRVGSTTHAKRRYRAD